MFFDEQSWKPDCMKSIITKTALLGENLEAGTLKFYAQIGYPDEC